MQANKKTRSAVIVLVLLALGALIGLTGAPSAAVSPTARSSNLKALALGPTAEPSSTAAPTSEPSSTTTPTPQTTLTPTRTAAATAADTAVQSTPTLTPTASPAQQCAGLAAQGKTGLYVMYVEPIPGLAWDPTPRQFRVGLCNSLPVMTMPNGELTVFVHFPGSDHGLGQTPKIRAQLEPGFHEFVFGTWTPGLENHVTVCVQRAIAEIEIVYSDNPPYSDFRPLLWPDGKSRLIMPIKCGGDYA